MDGRYGVKISTRWRRKSDNVAGESVYEKSVPYDIEPGDTAGFSFELTRPADAAGWWLEVDLFQQGVGWFADQGSEPLRLSVEPNL